MLGGETRQNSLNHALDYSVTAQPAYLEPNSGSMQKPIEGLPAQPLQPIHSKINCNLHRATTQTTLTYRKIEKAQKTITHKQREVVKHMVKFNKTDEKVIATLKESGELTLQEISEKTGETPKKAFKSLRKLFENELIETQARKYKISTKTLTAPKKDETELPE